MSSSLGKNTVCYVQSCIVLLYHGCAVDVVDSHSDWLHSRYVMKLGAMS